MGKLNKRLEEEQEESKKSVFSSVQVTTTPELEQH